MALHKKYHAPIDLCLENLATIAGTATESLIRTLSDFRSEGLVNIKGGTITIVNKKNRVP
jgi:CRP-like cAMP-binding protein